MTLAAVNFNKLLKRFLVLRGELSWVFIGQALGFVGSFIGIKILTTMMGPEGYGQLALGLTIAGLFNMYLYGPLANVVARFYTVYRERNDLGIYFSVLRKAHIFLALALCILAAIVGLVLWQWFGAEWALIALFATLYGIVGGINVSYISMQSAIRQRQVVALHQGADVWLRTGFSILLLYVFSVSGHIALLGYLLGTLLVTISQAFFARRNQEFITGWRKRNSDNGRIASCRREFTSYALSFIVFSGFAAISMYADRWIIQGVFGAHEVGIYAAIYQIGSAPVNLLFAMINQLVTPIIFERAGDLTSKSQIEGSAQLTKLTVAIATILSTVITLVSYLIGRQIIEVLTSGTFTQYHNILWLSVLGSSIFNIGQIVAIKGLYTNQPKIYFGPKGVQAVSFLIFAYFLSKEFGLYGISYSLCISSVLHLLLIVYVNSKIKLHTSINYQQ